MTKPESAIPNLRNWDIVVLSLSGGKDSQAMLDYVWHLASDQGVTDRLVTVFADLGDEDEWPGTADLSEELIAKYGDRPGARELAAIHAARYGIRHEVVARMVDDGNGGKVAQSLTEHIEQRGMWPDGGNRFCTADCKRGPIWTLYTRLAEELRSAWRADAIAAGAPTGKSRPRRVRILNVMGLRAQESPKRSEMAPLQLDEDASNLSVREVTEWLPIHSWSTDDVWERIFDAGTDWHWAYDADMPRLSCRFCVLASRTALIRAAQLDPAGARRRLDLERRMAARGEGRKKGRKVGSDFRQGLSMATIIEYAADATEAGLAVRASDWSA